MKAIAAAVRRYVQLAVHALVGDVSFSWRPPGWVLRSGRTVAARPVTSAIAVAALLAAGVGGVLLWNAWSHRPQPLTTDWIIRAPNLPDPSDQFTPQPLWITFDRSVGALAQIGKPSLQGVTMTPAVPGTWHWVSGSDLEFDPKQDWPADTDFQITLSRPHLFPARPADQPDQDVSHHAVRRADHGPGVLYQPEGRRTKQVTGTFTFSHAVDRDSLERGLQLNVQGTEPIFASGEPPFQLTFAQRDRVVYFRSAHVTLPQLSTYLRLTPAGDDQGRGGRRPRCPRKCTRT